MIHGSTTAEIAAAIAQLEEAFPGRIVVGGSDQTGTIITVREIDLSTRWTPRTGDLSFVLPYHYPDAPIYPYYVSAATPTGGLCQGLSSVHWRGSPVVQVSLRHNKWDANHDTALGCVIQAADWLHTR